MTCEPWDVIAVPFPFTDRSASKRRPALVLSTRGFNDGGHSILAMVTSAVHSGWPGDTLLQEHAVAGLRVPCLVRLKLFTLDNRLILRRMGRLTDGDRKQVAKKLRQYLR